MKVTYLGTTVLLFDDGTDQLLFDAHLTRPSIPHFLLKPLVTDEAMVKKIVDRFKIHRLRGIFISHYDHVLDAPALANLCHAPIYGSASTLNVARGGGVPEEDLREFHAGDTFTVGNYTVQVFPSVHSKAHWYNNDLGQPILSPVIQPARKKEYKEGGSYDFLVTNGDKRILIRPSYNFLPGELDGVHADVVFLGVAGITKSTPEEKAEFFRETLEKVQPRLVIPVHWDNFFTSLDLPVKAMPFFIEKTGRVHFELTDYCASHGIDTLVQLPLSSIEI